MLKVLIFCLSFLALPLFSYAHNSAVLLQYHNVSSETPSSTSISPEDFKAHLDWLKANQFEVLPLPKVIDTLKNGQSFSASKVVSLTFDDAHHSVCDTAWPILKRYNLPFTLFINTDAVERGFQSQCTWQQLNEMNQSGLMTAANHSHQHLNMVSSTLFTNKSEWSTLVTEEIINAQALIEKNLGKASKLFAYPYGEYNAQLASIVNNLGFIGFGQHSGAIGHHSDFMGLPRFPASGTFANLNTLSVKLNSLAFPATISPSADNPIMHDSTNNPPSLVIKPTKASLIKRINCFNGKGEAIETHIEKDQLMVRAPHALPLGRYRYTCTSQSEQAGRFYWISHQWLVEKRG